MSKIGALYYMMRLSYEEAIDDYNNKKTDTILSAYKKYYKINVGMEATDPEADIMMFYDEDNSLDCPIWTSCKWLRTI